MWTKLIELLRVWKKPRKMDLGKHVYDIILGYSRWRSNRVNDMVLLPIDYMVRPANLLPKRMPTEAEILWLEFEAEWKATNQKILILQKDLEQCHYDVKIQRDEIRKSDQKYKLLLEDFKKLGLENTRLKKGPKGNASKPNKRIKIEEDKKTKKL